MSNGMLSEEKAFIWKSKDNEVKIRCLQDLLELISGIEDADIDEEINTNLSKDNTELIDWLEQNFPENIKLIAELRNAINEFTPQQMRELMAREVRMILEKFN